MLLESPCLHSYASREGKQRERELRLESGYLLRWQDKSYEN